MTAWEFAQALTYGYENYAIYAPTDVGVHGDYSEYYIVYRGDLATSGQAIITGQSTEKWIVSSEKSKDYFTYKTEFVRSGLPIQTTYSSFTVPAYPTPELFAYGTHNAVWAQCICVALGVGFCLLMLSKIKIGGK